MQKFEIVFVFQHESEMKEKELDSQRQQKLIDSYKSHYSDKKKTIELLKEELDVHRKLVSQNRGKTDKLDLEIRDLKVLYTDYISQTGVTKPTRPTSWTSKSEISRYCTLIIYHKLVSQNRGKTDKLDLEIRDLKVLYTDYIPQTGVAKPRQDGQTGPRNQRSQGIVLTLVI